jgi:8-oxo-dGTP pyrophosphatase MutT (NUDIX family)
MALIDADVYYARLDKKLAGAGAFMTDPSDRVLLVKPNYRDHWGWPGGHVDPGESPEITCAREVEEELGLKPPVGRLLVVQWVPPLEERPFALIHFLFDCGTVRDGERIVLQDEELDGYGFFSPEDAASLMPSYLVARLQTAMAARQAGTTTYLPPPCC